MKVLRYLSVVVVLNICTASAQQLERPPLPYSHWGACPFECCTYREWTANASLKTYKTRNPKAAVAFEIKKGDRVLGVTGVVVTTKYGISKVLKPIEVGFREHDEKPQLSLRPGEFLYTLHYLGEGIDLFWYKGHVYSDSVAGPEPDPDPPSADLNIQTLSVATYDWWVKIRNSKGQLGWSQETKKFDHIDACE
jgi:hypothetical protein